MPPPLEKLGSAVINYSSYAPVNPLEFRGNYSATSNNMKLVHLAVDERAVTYFGTAMRGVGRPHHRIAV